MTLAAIFMMLSLHGCGVENKISLEIEQITSGPKHHLFGYIGQSLTIPWNKSDRGKHFWHLIVAGVILVGLACLVLKFFVVPQFDV